MAFGHGSLTAYPRHDLVESDAVRVARPVGGLGKRIPSNRDTAPQVDPTDTGGPQPREARCPVKFEATLAGITSRPC
jgi:hypothetical protein